MWDVAAPADWTFDDYNRGEKDIHAYLRQKGARQTSIAYAENRGLVFRGSIFHQTAPLRFAVSDDALSDHGPRLSSSRWAVPCIFQ